MLSNRQIFDKVRARALSVAPSVAGMPYSGATHVGAKSMAKSCGTGALRQAAVLLAKGTAADLYSVGG